MAGERLVLLHSPLLGASGWRPVAAALTERGRLVLAPSWPRLSSIGAGFYAALADSLAASLDGEGREPLLLVAHSGAGALVPALAARLRAPVTGVIFADAILPHPGRSWFDTAPAEMRERLRSGAREGGLPPWADWWPPGALARLVPDEAVLDALVAELELLPLAYFEEPAPTMEIATPGAYLQLSRAYQDEARTARSYGWPVTHLPLHHLAMLTHAESVAAALDSLAVKLVETAHG